MRPGEMLVQEDLRSEPDEDPITPRTGQAPLDATLLIERPSSPATSSDSGDNRCPLFALVSLNAKTAPTVEVPFKQLLTLSLSQDREPAVLTVGRHSECNVRLDDPRVSLRHFEIVARRRAGSGFGDTISFCDSLASLSYDCALVDGSTNGTTVNNSVVGKGNSVMLRSGDEICVLPANRVGPDKKISFLFRNTTEYLGSPRHLRKFGATQTLPKTEPVPEEGAADCLSEAESSIQDGSSKGRPELHLELAEHIACPICTLPIYKCVALTPCLHNFCSACFSEWFERKTDCPLCRERVTAVIRNHAMDAVIGVFLEACPDQQREEDDLRQMDAKDLLRLGSGGKIVRDVGRVGSAPRDTEEPRRETSSAAASRSSGPSVTERRREGTKICVIQ